MMLLLDLSLRWWFRPGNAARLAARKAGAASGGAKKEGASGLNWKAQLKYILLIALVGGGGLQTVFSVWEHLSSGAQWTHLSVQRPDELHRVFFGGDPWLVLCSNNTGSLPTLFERLSNEIARPAPPKGSKDKGGSRVAGYSIPSAVFDCDAALPSGKSTVERFKLPKSHPLVFTVANGNRPVPLQASFFVDNPKVYNNPEVLERAVTLAREHTKQQGVSFITSAAALRDKCFRARACALVYGKASSKSGKFDNATMRTVYSLRDSFRAVRFVALDANRLQLSLAPHKLPPVDSGVATWPRIILFKQMPRTPNSTTSDGGSSASGADSSSDTDNPPSSSSSSRRSTSPVGLGARTHRARFDHDTVAAFVRNLLETTASDVSADGAGIRPLARLPKLVVARRAPVPSSSSSSSSSTPNKSGSKSSAANKPSTVPVGSESTDSPRASSEAQTILREDERARHARRRAEMDAEEEVQFAHELTPEEQQAVYQKRRQGMASGPGVDDDELQELQETDDEVIMLSEFDLDDAGEEVTDMHRSMSDSGDASETDDEGQLAGESTRVVDDDADSDLQVDDVDER